MPLLVSLVQRAGVGDAAEVGRALPHGARGALRALAPAGHALDEADAIGNARADISRAAERVDVAYWSGNV